MGSITFAVAVVLGIICGLLFAFGFVFNSIVSSNLMGDRKGENIDFKKIGSEHFYAKENGHRKL